MRVDTELRRELQIAVEVVPRLLDEGEERRQHALAGRRGRLDEAGLSRLEACGDSPRPFLGSPVAGVAADEIIDGSSALAEIAARALGNPAYSNLPRKFKTAVTGHPSHDVAPEINDVAFVGTQSITGRVLSDTSVEIASIKRAMIAAARRVVLLADASKFKPAAFYKISMSNIIF